MSNNTFHGRHLSKRPIPALVTCSTDCGITEHSAWFPSVGAAARWVIYAIGKYPRLIYYVEPTKPLITDYSKYIAL